MKCPTCRGVLTTRRGDYPYEESGLPNVVLVDIEIHRCAACKEETAEIPRIEQLHRALAFSIATHPARLASEEIRFLRKYLGWSGKDFARTMGVAPETVSRWENDKDRMSLLADRLLRTMVLRLRPVEEYRTEEIAELGLLDSPPPPLGMHIKANQWQPRENAA